MRFRSGGVNRNGTNFIQEKRRRSGAGENSQVSIVRKEPIL